LFVFAFDFSPRAIQFVQKHEKYDDKRCCAFVCDVTKESIPDLVPDNSVDIAMIIFVLSAISPQHMRNVLLNVRRVLKDGGYIFVRDYGLYDMAQIRFAEKGQSKLDENFYVRQDGTRAYYFSKEFLEELFVGAGFKTSKIEYAEREVVNRKLESVMNRNFIQAKFQK